MNKIDVDSYRGDLYRLKPSTAHRLVGISQNGSRFVLGFIFPSTEDQRIRIDGVEPKLITSSVLRKHRPITITVIFGTKLFDHSNGGPDGPQWQELPAGLLTEDERRGPYPAALVYGSSLITVNPETVHLFFGRAGQDADEFRQELLTHLQG